MNPQTTDPLADLRDIHLPPPVEFWLPAPGWWMLVLLLLIAGALLLHWQKQRRQGARRHALAEVDTLSRQNQTLQELATSFSILLRRVAIVRFDEKTVSALYGAAWKRFLQEQAEVETEDLFELLATAPYAPEGSALFLEAKPETRPLLIETARRWIRRNT